MKNFMLSYYKNTFEGVHIQRVEKSLEAQKPHTHDYFQIYYIIKGSLLHYTEKDCSFLSQSDMFIIPPGKSHYIAKADNASFYSFSFYPESLRLDLNSLAFDFLKGLSKREEIFAKTNIAPEEILFANNLMDEIYREFNNKKPGHGDIIKACATSLITLFARNYFKNSSDMIAIPDNRSLMIHCVEYIDKNYSQNLTLSEMVKSSAMSKSCFCKLFNEITGTTFNKYLNNIRIKNSLKYIKKGYKLTAIYGLLGYNDFSSFYRNFKKIMGMSPEEYKKNNQN